jgi:hypothetical protein
MKLAAARKPPAKPPHPPVDRSADGDRSKR